jgi:hypothetical protein
MIDSDFWRDFAAGFRNLGDERLLVANWERSDSGYQWWLGPPALTPFILQFEALARRAGTKLDPSNPQDPLVIWLSALKQETRVIKHYGLALVDEELTYRDSGARGFHKGVIRWVANASADFCCVLESRALETEHIAEADRIRNSKPENWSPLRRDVEAYKIIKRLGTGRLSKFQNHLYEDFSRNKTELCQRISLKIKSFVPSHPCSLTIQPLRSFRSIH